MKEKFFVLVVIVFSMLAIPLSALSKAEGESVLVANPLLNEPYKPQSAPLDLGEVRVLKDNVVTAFSTRDYIFGVIAAEMPALYETEAIKAQAVAAYTFTLYRIQGNSSTDYDITADGQTAQCFITREEAAVRWGEKAGEYTKKIDDCISEVEGYFLSYDNQPIFAAYHAISPGKTNSCKDVWDKDLPYLISVDSIGDTLDDGFLSEVQFTAAEITEKLKSVATAPTDQSNYFSNIITSETGYVKNAVYCDKEITGQQLRDLLGLRSCNFTVDYSEGNYKFTVKGYGHGVGMSQTGANYLAKQGKTFDEILLHYYSGASLQKN